MTTEKKKIDCAFCRNDANGCHFHTKSGARRQKATTDSMRVQCQFCTKEKDGKCLAKSGSCGDHATVKLTKRRRCFKFVLAPEKKTLWERGRSAIATIFREWEHRHLIKKVVEVPAEVEKKEESRIILP